MAEVKVQVSAMRGLDLRGPLVLGGYVDPLRYVPPSPVVQPLSLQLGIIMMWQTPRTPY